MFSSKSKSKSKPRPILQGVTVAVAGPLGHGWSDADVARWLGYHGGRFSSEMTDNVTHLLCTLADYSRKTGPVKTAMGSGRSSSRPRKCNEGTPGYPYIVVKDWLEDSLHKHRRLREREYLLRRILHEEQSRPEAVEKRRLQLAAKGRQQAESFVDTTLYRIYRDCTGFAYKVTIRRDHAASGTLGERYVLHLFESLAKPHLYWFAARHYKSNRHTQPRHYRPSDTCKPFSTEFRHFCDLFKRKTGIEWDARLVGKPPTRTKNGALADRQDDPSQLPAFFRYDKPGKWMPIGAIENEANLPPEEDDKMDVDIPIEDTSTGSREQDKDLENKTAEENPLKYVVEEDDDSTEGENEEYKTADTPMYGNRQHGEYSGEDKEEVEETESLGDIKEQDDHNHHSDQGDDEDEEDQKDEDCENQGCTDQGVMDEQDDEDDCKNEEWYTFDTFRFG